MGPNGRYWPKAAVQIYIMYHSIAVKKSNTLAGIRINFYPIAWRSGLILYMGVGLPIPKTVKVRPRGSVFSNMVPKS